MLNPISQAIHSASASESTAPQPSPHRAQPTTPSAPTDTVQLSAAAKAMQEALETPAQTAHEAAQGDIQAKHLLANEAAEKAQG